MATNLATNFDPSDPNLGGLQLSAGTARQGEVVKMVDEITTIGSASFGRITSSSPTPAGLQSMAGSASMGSTGYIDRYSSNHGGKFDAIYFKADPALSDGDQAVAIGLFCFRNGHGLILIDPVTTGTTDWTNQANPPGFMADWNGYYQTQSDMLYRFSQMGYYANDSQPGEMFFSRLQSTGTDTPGTDSYLQIDHRFWCFCADEYVVWKSVTEAEDRTSGVGMIWFNPPPTDGHVSRSEAPAIMARSFRRWSSGEAMAPAYNGGSRALKPRIREQMGFVPNSTDVQGREIIQPQEVYVNNPLPAYHGEIPGLRVVRDEAIAVWDTVVIDGDNWVCFHRDSGRGYLTRYENSK